MSSPCPLCPSAAGPPATSTPSHPSSHGQRSSSCNHIGLGAGRHAGRAVGVRTARGGGGRWQQAAAASAAPLPRRPAGLYLRTLSSISGRERLC